MTIAIHITDTSAPDELIYVFADHLGSASILADDSGTAIPNSAAHYLPFGDWRTEPTADETSRWYTGHIHDNLGRNDLGLIYMNARFYLPHIGRFASADSVVPGKENPQAFNRYAYVANNPLLFLDESGHCWGAFSFVRDINVGGYGYGSTCSNIDQALTIVQHPDATLAEKVLAGGYIVVQAVAHGTVVVGTGVTTIGCLTGAGTVICTGAGSAVTTASADGDPSNEVAAVANAASRLTSSAAPHINQFWNRVTNFMGNKVYQRNDLIDPNRVNSAGKTSLELMRSGRAPIGPDGQSIHLHHMLQTNHGPIAEITRTLHQKATGMIHINPNTIPSGINRTAWNYWRYRYWIERANDFIAD